VSFLNTIELVCPVCAVSSSIAVAPALALPRARGRPPAAASNSLPDSSRCCSLACDHACRVQTAPTAQLSWSSSRRRCGKRSAFARAADDACEPRSTIKMELAMYRKCKPQAMLHVHRLDQSPGSSVGTAAVVAAGGCGSTAAGSSRWPATCGQQVAGRTWVLNIATHSILGGYGGGSAADMAAAPAAAAAAAPAAARAALFLAVVSPAGRALAPMSLLAD